MVRVPVFLCIDLEPDERHVQVPHAESLRGIEAIFEHLEGLRPRLAAASGEQVRFLWFLRCDPQIAAVYGSADHLLTRYAETFERLVAAGDGLGLHVHPWRREEGSERWIADYGNPAWIEECIEMAFAAYRAQFGAACELHRFGDRWLGTEVIPLLERLGVRFDLTVEPGARGTRSLAPGDVTTGSIPDYTRAPREPYRPSRSDFCLPDPAAGPGLWIVPLSAGDPSSALPLSWRIGRRVRFPFRPAHRPLQMFREWNSPKAFWDMVQRHVESLERPYLAFAIRSGDPEAPDERRVRAILDHLPEHRIASRLRLTDPEHGLRLLGYELHPRRESAGPFPSY
jgi:hypothetical protein